MYETISVSERKGNGFKDLTGKKYGRLKVVGLSAKKAGRKSYWVCQCECGNKKVVRSDSLKCGNVQSCGCLKKEQDAENLTKNHRHKESHTRLHNVWLGIKGRCLNSKNESYSNYGGRGIEICDDWLNSYENFRDWAIENGYEEKLTIERIDVNGNYEPGNCTWIPSDEQANNRRSTVWIEWKGKRQNATQWAKELGFKPKTIMERFRKGQRPPYLFRELEQ